jgi:hypothetical protein
MVRSTRPRARAHRDKVQMATAKLEETRGELPHVLTITDLAVVLRRSENLIERQLTRGTFPIPTITGLGLANARRTRLWRRVDVLDFLGEGTRPAAAALRPRRARDPRPLGDESKGRSR